MVAGGPRHNDRHIDGLVARHSGEHGIQRRFIDRTQPQTLRAVDGHGSRGNDPCASDRIEVPMIVGKIPDAPDTDVPRSLQPLNSMVARNQAIAYRRDAMSSDDIEMISHALVGGVFRRHQKVMAPAMDQPALEARDDVAAEVGSLGAFEGNAELILVSHRDRV
jgi:hypothetical protein